MRALACLGLVAAGCFTATPANGSLGCNDRVTPSCPGGYHCAVNLTCWRNGAEPDLLGAVDATLGPTDLYGVDFFGADLEGVDFLPTPPDLAGLDGASPSDAATIDDLTQKCSADVCDGNILKTCQPAGDYLTTNCGAIGCADTPNAHCKRISPQAPVVVADLTRPALAIEHVSSNITLNGETGQIPAVRNPNADPAVFQVDNYVGFRVENGVGVFNFQSLTVDEGATVTIVGKKPVAITATTDITIVGKIVFSSAGDGGGAAGGGTGQPGMGAGGGVVAGATLINGGGAGYGDKGGSGTSDLSYLNGGAIYGASLQPLVGGSGGSGGNGGGAGGAGGGALQLVASGTITLGGGSTLGGINVGGFGGGSGASGAGGGGSGGAILLQGADVKILDNGGLAANGGGGGCAGSVTTAAENGALSSMAAKGGVCGGSSGGTGGVASATIGATGGGGGGGAVGRIRIDTLSGTPSLPASYVLSPAVSDTNLIGEHPTTFVTILTE